MTSGYKIEPKRAHRANVVFQSGANIARSPLQRGEIVCFGILYHDIKRLHVLVPGVYIHYLPDIVNVWIHISTSLGCFRPRTFFF